MANPEEENPLVNFGALIILLLVGGFVYYSWYVGLLFVVSFIIWILSLEHENLFFKATGFFFLPVTLGLGLVSFFVFALNVLELTFSPEWLRALEASLIMVRMEIRGWTFLNLPYSIILLLILLTLTFAIPRLKLVTHFRTFSKYFGQFSLLTMTMVSFSLFVQIPLEERAEEAEGNLRQEYRAQLRAEKDAIAESLAGETVKRSVEVMDNDQVVFLQDLAETIRDTETYKNAKQRSSSSLQDSPKYPFRREVTKTSLVRSLANVYFNFLLQEKGVKDYSKQSTEGIQKWNTESKPELGKAANSSYDWKQKQALLKKQKQHTKNAETRVGQTVEALKTVFTNVLGTALPEVDAILRTYLKQIVSEYSSRFFDRIVEKGIRWNPTQLREIVGNNFEKIVPKSSVIEKMMVPRSWAKPKQAQVDSYFNEMKIKTVEKQEKRLDFLSLRGSGSLSEVERLRMHELLEKYRSRIRSRITPRR